MSQTIARDPSRTRPTFLEMPLKSHMSTHVSKNCRSGGECSTSSFSTTSVRRQVSRIEALQADPQILSLRTWTMTKLTPIQGQQRSRWSDSAIQQTDTHQNNCCRTVTAHSTKNTFTLSCQRIMECLRQNSDTRHERSRHYLKLKTHKRVIGDNCRLRLRRLSSEHGIYRCTLTSNVITRAGRAQHRDRLLRPIRKGIEATSTGGGLSVADSEWRILRTSARHLDPAREPLTLREAPTSPNKTNKSIVATQSSDVSKWADFESLCL
ncbi:hypothetical protein QAD02_024010 [Eretmocerus hayati]|uniref:Uncharacterized protein n=1 Tax=Eretmocerus hayati TaxID=131215 RepID=A0ACC2Q2C2_9HYME|nr:hypothetical protein QAD02_024010 [Eretmocerus hayati]